MKRLALAAAGTIFKWTGQLHAAEVTVPMNAISSSGVGDLIGTIVFRDTPNGLRIQPDLSGLTEGPHGFHVHQNPACGTMVKDGRTVTGLAAGGHFDPGKSHHHAGPTGAGHLGDLPALYVDSQGHANRVSHAARVKTSDLGGRSVMIHAGGDNYSDQPARIGGGGARVACGIVAF